MIKRTEYEKQSGADHDRVKGKQVKILYDLVTVCMKYTPSAKAIHWATGKEKGVCIRNASQETCRLLVQEQHVPDHE